MPGIQDKLVGALEFKDDCELTELFQIQSKIIQANNQKQTYRIKVQGKYWSKNGAEIILRVLIYIKIMILNID